MDTFNYTNNELYCEQTPLRDIVQQFGTPLYVYSEKYLTDAFHYYQDSFKDIKPLICYAIKANSNLSILKHFAALGAGFDIVSGGELTKVIAAGGEANKTIFSGVGKTAEEIEYALEQNIFCFNVESENELYRINEIALKKGKKAPISLRVNPNVDAQTHPYISTGLSDNKFGIAHHKALSVYLKAASCEGIEIIGIDCHIGSQILQTEPLIEAFDKIIELIDELKENNIHLKHIDMGGGVGIQYSDSDVALDLSIYASALKDKLADRGLGLILEPGRSLVGNAGVLVTHVEYIKKSQNKNFVIIDAAMNDLIRPALYQAYHSILPMTISDNPTSTADIVGPICESSDFLAQNREIATKEGDYLVVKSAGAYAFSMASNYNIRKRGAEVLVSKDKFKLIRQRETVEQLIENEKSCL